MTSIEKINGKYRARIFRRLKEAKTDPLLNHTLLDAIEKYAKAVTPNKAGRR